MSANVHPVLGRDQALIPQTYKKSLQSRALLDHYQAAQMRKIIDGRIASDERNRQMELAKMQSEQHKRETERRRAVRESKKEEYSQEYQQMIQSRKEREKGQRERDLSLEQQMLQGQNWLPDDARLKQIQRMKKIQYGKQLQKHLKLQQQRRVNEAHKIKQQRQRMRRQAEEAALRHHQSRDARFKRKSMLEYMQGDMQGVRGALNWSTTDMRQQQKQGCRQQQNQGCRQQQNQGWPLTPRMDRMLKVQHQKYYEKGSPDQYKSQSLRRYYQRYEAANPEPRGQAYNPITNPIPYKYKNPNVLRLLSSYD